MTNNTERPVFEQDLQDEQKPGGVFLMMLLMKEHCPTPSKETILACMEQHLGKAECIYAGESAMNFAVKERELQFQDGNLFPMLMMTACENSKTEKIDPFTRSQMSADAKEILAACKHQVVAMDMLGSALHYRDRADLLMDYLEALLELYPSCEAVYFPCSAKLMTVEQIRTSDVPREYRFLDFVVNLRHFYVEKTTERIVDTLGMSLLFLPDLQYHFKAMDFDSVLRHARSTICYLYDHDNPIEDGDGIDSICDGEMDQSVLWKCHYEHAMVQPARGVLDICMNEYAAGNRDYDA